MHTATKQQLQQPVQGKSVPRWKDWPASPNPAELLWHPTTICVAQRSLAMAAMICHVCGGSSFSGGDDDAMVCLDCFTQSQVH